MSLFSRTFGPLTPPIDAIEAGLFAYVECPACGGDREWEVWTGYDPRDGSPTGYMERCDRCDEHGGSWEQVQPLEGDEDEFFAPSLALNALSAKIEQEHAE